MAILDVDYQNTDFPDEAFYHPEAVFSKLEPVFQSVRRELPALGMEHIAVMTGQGYHFAWRITDASATERKLRTLTRPLPSLEAKYRHDHPLTAEVVPLVKGRSHAGLGLLLEYLAHRVLGRAYGQARLPTVLTGLVVGSQATGREAVSLDLSTYGDPLHLRYSRCAFSLYHKASRPDLCVVCLPRKDEPWDELLRLRSDLGLAAEYAKEATGLIPEAEAGTRRLLDEYLASDLRRFHRYFESGWHDEPEDWPQGYDRLNLASFPPCVAWPLACPNDALSRPGNVQNIARVLVSQGWHPRAVAGLVRSKFERDFGWGVNWLNYDAATRADFYVRTFCGLVAAGLDELRDLNCISHQEKGLCPLPWCGFNLADYREPLWRALHI